MLRQRAALHPNVLIDIDTQVDFLSAGGKRPVANPSVVENIERVVRWGRRCRVTCISSLDIHRATDPRREVPVHCLAESSGAEKIPSTLMSRRILVQTDDTINLPHDLLMRYRQILFIKRGDDLTCNPKVDRLLTEIQVSNFVVFGVGLEESIRLLALELLARNKSVWVVQDACGYWDAQAADLTLRQIVAKNGRVMTTAELLELKPDMAGVRQSILMRRNMRSRRSTAEAK